MRITVVHSFYSTSSPSGETVAVLQHVDALRRAGHEVTLERLDTDVEQLTPLYTARTAARVATGIGPAPRIDPRETDLVHVHNLFPNYGLRWLHTVDVPVVATLHNYRALCASANFYRDGRVCTDCLDRRRSTPAVVHGCYRNRLATVPLVLRPRFDADPVLRRADRLIVLSERMRDLYEQAGVAADGMELVPNFMPADQDGGPGPGGEGWVYVGRLNPEKGIVDALRQWPTGYELSVIGAGESEQEARAVAPDGVEFLGSLPRQEVQDRLRRARGLLFPSKWFEGAPMVYSEALAAGTPVLAFDPSSVASFVRADGTGVVAESLMSALPDAHREFAGLRRHCRSVFDERYGEDQWVATIEDLYERVIRSRSIA